MVTEQTRVRRPGREGTPVLSVVHAEGSTESGSMIDEIVREGASRMLAAALEAGVNECRAELAAERDELGHRLVVPNGRHRPRTVVTVDAALGRWRAITGAHLVALVRSVARFENGILVERGEAAA